MSLKKFQERRLLAQKKAEEELARIEEEEARARERLLGPLVARYTTLFQSAITDALNARIEDLEKARFRRADIRKRLESVVSQEMDELLNSAQDPEHADIEPSTPSTPPQQQDGGKEADQETESTARQDPSAKESQAFFDDDAMDDSEPSTTPSS